MEFLHVLVQPEHSGLNFHLENVSEPHSFQSPYLRPSKVSISIHQPPLNFRYTTPLVKERLRVVCGAAPDRTRYIRVALVKHVLC